MIVIVLLTGLKPRCKKELRKVQSKEFNTEKERMNALELQYFEAPTERQIIAQDAVSDNWRKTLCNDAPTTLVAPRLDNIQGGAIAWGKINEVFRIKRNVEYSIRNKKCKSEEDGRKSSVAVAVYRGRSEQSQSQFSLFSPEGAIGNSPGQRPGIKCNANFVAPRSAANYGDTVAWGKIDETFIFKRNEENVEYRMSNNEYRSENSEALKGRLTADLIKGDYIAVHRNKLLAEAFYLRGDIEKFGTGFFRIQAELQHSPELRFTLDSVHGFTRSGLEVNIKKKNPTQDTAQDTAQVAAQVRGLIINLEGDMSREEMQEKLKLTHRENFRKFYLLPTLSAELIEMTIPNKPNSKNQRYRLTIKGKQMKNNLIKNKHKY